MDRLRQALQLIANASEDDFNKLQDEDCILGAYKNLALRAKPGHIDINSVISAIQHSLPLVLDFVRQRPEVVVETVPHTYEDSRITDIRLLTGQDPTPLHQFRALLAYRSLTLEFDRWQRGHGKSRIWDIAQTVRKAKSKKEGEVATYVEQQGLPDLAAIAITHGIKIIVLEWLCSSAGISLLLALGSLRTFKRLRYDSIPAMAARLRAREGCENIVSHLPACSSFLECCQRLYNESPILNRSTQRTPRDLQQLMAIQRVCIIDPMQNAMQPIPYPGLPAMTTVPNDPMSGVLELVPYSNSDDTGMNALGATADTSAMHQLASNFQFAVLAGQNFDKTASSSVVFGTANETSSN